MKDSFRIATRRERSGDFLESFSGLFQFDLTSPSPSRNSLEKVAPSPPRLGREPSEYSDSWQALQATSSRSGLVHRYRRGRK